MHAGDHRGAVARRIAFVPVPRTPKRLLRRRRRRASRLGVAWGVARVTVAGAPLSRRVRSRARSMRGRRGRASWSLSSGEASAVKWLPGIFCSQLRGRVAARSWTEPRSLSCSPAITSVGTATSAANLSVVSEFIGGGPAYAQPERSPAADGPSAARAASRSTQYQQVMPSPAAGFKAAASGPTRQRTRPEVEPDGVGGGVPRVSPGSSQLTFGRETHRGPRGLPAADARCVRWWILAEAPTSRGANAARPDCGGSQRLPHREAGGGSGAMRRF